MQFGIFCVQYSKEKAPVFNDYVNCDYVNTFLVGDKDYTSENATTSFKAIAAAHKTCFIYFYELFFKRVDGQGIVDVGEDYASGPKTVLKENWKQILLDLKDYLEQQPFYDAIDGFYIDEPFLCGVSPDDFETVTGFLAEKFGKRIFCCFSVAGVAPDVWTAAGVPAITPKAGRYITDAGFDMYHAFDEKYAYITEQMKNRLGNRDDVRIWQIPCIMNYRGDKDEDHAVKHIDGLYELLKKEKNPGGLMCYAYYVAPSETEQIGNIGFEHLRGRFKGDAHWKKLEDEIERIGKEICLGDR